MVAVVSERERGTIAVSTEYRYRSLTVYGDGIEEMGGKAAPRMSMLPGYSHQ